MVGVTGPCSGFVREMNLDQMLAAMKNGVEEDIEVRTQHVLDFDHVNSGILKLGLTSFEGDPVCGAADGPLLGLSDGECVGLDDGEVVGLDEG